MAQAKRVRSTPRKTAPKKQSSKKPTPPERSAIIKQCIIYFQSMAAYNAGFEADPTADSDVAGAGDGTLGGIALRKAERALLKLASISAAPSIVEIKAKINVLEGIFQFERGNNLPDEAGEYIKHFAAELREYFKNVPSDVAEGGG
jgi:hypothetical protein